MVYPDHLELDVQCVSDKPGFMEVNPELRNEFGQRVSMSRQLDISDETWDNNWVMVEQKHYLVRARLFSVDGLITITENLLFEVEFPSQHFEVIKHNSLNTEFLVRATVATPYSHDMKIDGRLATIKSPLPQAADIDKQKVRTDRDFKVTKPIRIPHPTERVYLPLADVTVSKSEGQVYKLSAEGGSGSYKWASAKDEIVVAMQNGKIFSRSFGITNVTVYDNHNTANSAWITVEVKPISKFTWLELDIEVEQSHSGNLFLIAMDP